MGHEERREDHRSVLTVKSGRKLHVVLIRSVEAFNELLKGPPLLRLGIEVLKPDDLVMLNIRRIAILSIQEMNAGRVGRIAVSNEDDLLTGSGGTDRFVHGNDGRLSSPVVCHVIGRDLQVL